MYKKLLNLFFFIVISINVFSQSKWNSKKSKIVIPFELTHNLIIVDAEINDVKLNMLLDTGSDKSILFSFPENDTIEFYDTKKIKINGLGNGESLEAFVSNNNKFKVKEYVDDKFQILLITDQNINLVNKLGVPINGIIGSTFFKDFLVEINYQKKKIILHKDNNKSILKLSNRYVKKDIEIVYEKPYINVVSNLNEQDGVQREFKLLVDTGLGDGLWLFENDSIKCKDKFIIDILGRGLGGDIQGKRSRVETLKLNNFVLENALVSYPDSLSFSQLDIVKGRNGSLGGGIMKRFNWFLDYQNKKFYFRKNSNFNTPFNFNMSGIEIQHVGLIWISEKVGLAKQQLGYSNNLSNSSTNTFVFDKNIDFKYKFKLKPLFEIYAIRKDSPAYIVGLKVGDKIVKINGNEAYNYTIQKITDLFQSEEGKTIKIEVDRKGVNMEFKFKLQKIL